MTRTITVALAFAGWLAAPVRAEDNVDARTMDLLMKLGTLYRDAKSMHVDMAINGAVEIDGQDKRDVNLKGVIDFKRPNQFALRTVLNKDAKAGPDVVCDGKKLVIHAKRMKQYTESKAPAKLGGVSQSMMRIGQLNTGMLFQNVLADDPAAALLDGVTEGKHVGTEKIGGKEAHHLKFKQPNLDWEIWVAAEGQPFVLKAKSVSELPNGKLTTVETYTNWKVNENSEKDPFTFKAPEGAEKVDQIGG